MGFFSMFLSLLIQSGKVCLTKSETRCPKGPCPSQIPNKCSQVLLLIFGDVI